MTDQEFIYKIAQGDNRTFTILYNQYRSEFVGYIGKRYKGDSETIFELYQDACVALYDNIHSGKLQVLNPGVKLKTYLFRIGYNKLVDKYRKNKKSILYREFDYVQEDDLQYDDHCTERFAIIRQAVDAMKEPCNTILSLYYWENKKYGQPLALRGFDRYLCRIGILFVYLRIVQKCRSFIE